MKIKFDATVDPLWMLCDSDHPLSGGAFDAHWLEGVLNERLAAAGPDSPLEYIRFEAQGAVGRWALAFAVAGADERFSAPRHSTPADLCRGLLPDAVLRRLRTLAGATLNFPRPAAAVPTNRS